MEENTEDYPANENANYPNSVLDNMMEIFDEDFDDLIVNKKENDGDNNKSVVARESDTEINTDKILTESKKSLVPDVEEKLIENKDEHREDGKIDSQSVLKTADAVESFIAEGGTDFETKYEKEVLVKHLENEVKNPNPSSIKDDESTWDYSLLKNSEADDNQLEQGNGKRRKTIWVTDSSFLTKLEGLDCFGNCDHDIIKIMCPCDEQNTFPVCTKCHRVFCSNKCAKQAKENKGTKKNAEHSSQKLPAANNNTTVLNRNESKTDPRSTESIGKNSNRNTNRLRTSSAMNHRDMDGPGQGTTHNQSLSLGNRKSHSVSTMSGDGLLPNPHQHMNFQGPRAFPDHSQLSLQQQQQIILPPSNGLYSPYAHPIRNPGFDSNLPQMSNPNFNYLHHPNIDPQIMAATMLQFPPNREMINNTTLNQSTINTQPPQNNFRDIESFNSGPLYQKNNPKEPLMKILRDPWRASSTEINVYTDASNMNNYFNPNFNPNHGNYAEKIATDDNQQLSIEKSLSSRGLGRGGYSPKFSEGTGDSNSNPLSKVNVSTDGKQNSAGKIQSQHYPQKCGTNNGRRGYIDQNTVSHQPQSEHKNAFQHNPNSFKKSPSKNSKSMNVTTETSTLPTLAITEKPFIAFGIPMLVGYSYGEAITDFYVWNTFGHKNNDSIKAIVDSFEGFDLMKTPVVGKYCIANYTNSDDPDVNGWYRARITGVNGEHVKVYFLDYGNEEFIHKEAVGVMPGNLMKINPSAIRLGIADLQMFENTDNQHLENIFVDQIVDKWIRVTIFEENDTGIFGNIPQKYEAVIELSRDGRWINVAEIIKDMKLGTRLPLWKQVFKSKEYRCDDFPAFQSIRQEYEVCFSHVTDLNDFYVIPCNLMAARQVLMENLNKKKLNFEEYPMQKWFDSNYICATRRHGEWARAKISEISNDGQVKIRFVDFGDTATVKPDQLKAIPTEFLSECQLAYRCSLPIFPTSRVWDDKSESFQIISKIAESNTSAFLIVFALEMEISTHIVEMFIGESTSGLTKHFLKKDRDLFHEAYDVDLSIRKKLRNSPSIQDPNKIPQTQTRNLSKTPNDSREERQDVVKVSVAMQKLTTDAKNKYESRGNNDFDVIHSKPEIRPDSFISVKQNNNISTTFTQSQHHQNSITKSLDEDEGNSGSTEGTAVLQLPPAPSLTEYLRMEISISHVASFNRLFIKPQTFIDTFMQLQDDIVDCVDLDEKFDKRPPINALVIAPFDKKNHCRATIERYVEGGKVEVNFVDFGNSATMAVSELKPACSNLFEVHKLAYEVKLREVDDNPKLLLKSDFDNFMVKASKLKYILEWCWCTDEVNIVNLTMKNARKSPLSEMILQKQVWEWEKLDVLTDGELLLNSDRWSNPARQDDIMPCVLPVKKKLRGEVSRLNSEGDIFLINIADDMIARDMDVLQNQISRYIDKITPDPFFPMLNEVILIYLKNVPELEQLNLRGIGKWNRCWRESQDYYRNLDCDEIYPLNSDLNKYLEIRRLFPEFLRIPIGVAECCLKNFKPSPEAIKRLQEKCKPGAVIEFTVDHFNETDFIYNIELSDY